MTPTVISCNRVVLVDSNYAYWALYNYFGVRGIDIQLVLEDSDDHECSYCMPVLGLSL